MAKLQSINRLGSCDLESLTVSGMTSAQLAAYSTQFGNYPQIKNANVITLTIGANDLLGPLYAYMGTVPVGSTQEQITQGFISNVLPTIQQDIAGKCKQVQGNILTALTAIHKLNPKARVYIMGYYDPFPTLKRAYGVSMTPMVALLNTNIVAAVAKAKLRGALVSYVDTYIPMALCPDAYLAPLDIHPTVAGHRAIAAMFWTHMKPYL
jgi:lysophospholipase L1-like esterase